MTTDDRIRAHLAEGDLRSLFLEALGWDQPRVAAFSIEVDGQEVEVRPVGQKRGLHVLEIPAEEPPPADIQYRVDVEVSQRAPERMLVFTSAARQVWRWPEPRKGGGVRLVAHESAVEQPSPSLIQRLAGVRFTFAEEETLTLPVVKDRIRTQFNAERVTARFYAHFEQGHASLQGALLGISDAELRRWYASLLMNRLVFIYFLQRKGFLNGDRDYLRTCLRRIQQLRGPDEFYGFYRELLLPMFHHGFGSYEHRYPDAEVAEILGDVPYVNGGIFEEHEIEAEHEIRVADAEFEAIFDFFDQFSWHLDDRPHGDPNMINPDVIGYIFERYINLTASGKRREGAYYTKEDVTSYMVGVTLLPRLLERMVAGCGLDPFILLRSSPLRYLPESLRHGRGPEGWAPTPLGAGEIWSDPGRWDGLAEFAYDPAVQLPDESWVETLDRRERVDALLADIEAGRVDRVDEFVTRNLDSRTLLADALHHLDAPADVLAAWQETSATAVIDPTCGSGAFLFAALDVLDEVYAALLERARTQLAGDEPDAREILTDLVAEADGHPNDAYYRRKHAALSNLYGLDIMHEAIETAKLRLFLALASKLEGRHEIEPLPDLDFNLRSGNLLVGFLNVDDARRRVGVSTFEALSAVDEFVPKAEHLAELRAAFVEAQANDDAPAAVNTKRTLASTLADVKADADHTYAQATGVDPHTPEFEGWWLRSLPFHWMLEFPELIERGGFDVVVGNPPYVRRGDVPYAIQGYRTAALPDIYAPCAERSLELLAPGGRFAMILPISFQFSGRHRAAREVILEEGAVWISTFSRNPSALFTAGLGVRNAIAVTGPNPDGVWTTDTRRWRSEARDTLFQTLRYASLAGRSRETAWLPRTGDRNVAVLLERLVQSGQRLGSSTDKRGRYALGFKVTALYYLPVYTEVPPVYDPELKLVAPPKDSALYFGDEEGRLLAYALLAGELALMWWMSTGDDFDVTAQLLKEFPISLAGVESRRAELLDYARKLEDAAQDTHNLLFTPYAGLMTGSWDLRRVRHHTRTIDRLVLEALGLADFLPAVLKAVARFDKSTGERPGTARGLGWFEERRASSTSAAPAS